MLGKLFKHEWKTASKLLLLVHGIVLLLAVVSRLYLQASGALVNMGSNWIALLLVMADVMIVITVALYTYFYIAYRFYRNIFTDQGYLTNTLPVTPAQIILSKGFVGVLWTVIDMIVILLAVFIMVFQPQTMSGFFADIRRLFELLLENNGLSVWIVLISLLLTPFMMVIQVYFSIALGNLASHHKVLTSVGAFVGVYVVEQILGIILLQITGYPLFNSSSTPGTGLVIGFNNSTLDASTVPVLLINLLLSVALMIGFWFGTKYIMERKLNLQ